MKSDNIAGFDVLRLVAALLVLMQHSYGATGVWDREWFVLLSGRQITGGYIGVAMFFIISGFLVQQSLERNPGLWPFLRARALRILPALAVVLLVTALVIGPLASTLAAGDYFATGEAWRYLANLKLFPLHDRLPGVFEDNVLKGAVNGSLWTLPYEVTCYALLFVAASLFTRSRDLRAASFTCAALASFALWLVYEYSLQPKLKVVGIWGINSRDLASFAAFFFAGSALSQLAPEKFCRAPIWVLALLVLIVGSAAGFAKPATQLALPVLTLALAYKLPVAASGRSLRERVGDLSYGAYLWAFPVQQMLADPHVLNLRQPELHLALTIVIVLPIAWLSWHGIERPALKWKRRP